MLTRWARTKDAQAELACCLVRLCCARLGLTGARAVTTSACASAGGSNDACADALDVNNNACAYAPAWFDFVAPGLG